jgi:hypothetical protein
LKGAHGFVAELPLIIRSADDGDGFHTKRSRLNPAKTQPETRVKPSERA